MTAVAVANNAQAFLTMELDEMAVRRRSHPIDSKHFCSFDFRFFIVLFLPSPK